MKWVHRRLCSASAAAAVLFLAGCGGPSGGSDATSSMTEAQVKGVVTVDGKPARKGRITFNPANVNRKVGLRTAKIQPDGTYEITTYVGQNLVSASHLGVKNPRIEMAAKTFDVQPGPNSFNLELP